MEGFYMSKDGRDNDGMIDTYLEYCKKSSTIELFAKILTAKRQ